jgi:transcriptional regulator with XRE-family HTH domain
MSPSPPEQESQGARIRTARQARGMTQEALAHAVGVTRSAVAQWETGRAGQVGANLARLGAVLGVSASWLMGESAAPSGAPQAEDATELALLRLYRACGEEDRAWLLRMAARLARAAAQEAPEGAERGRRRRP